MPTRKKRVLGAASAVAALALVGGVAAQFTTSTTSAPQSIGTGTLALTLDNVAPTVWTDDISNLAAGDSMQRFVDVRNSGTLKIANVSIAQTNTLGDLLTAPSDINVKFESCSVAWNATTGVCAGQITTAFDSSVRSWGSDVKPMSTFSDFGAGDVRHLRVTTSLAATATNAVQAKSGTITYTFGANQRAAGTNGQVSDAAVPLVQPTKVTTTAISPTSVKVSFADTNNGAASYVVTWSETGNSAVAPQSATVPAGTTDFTVSGLTAGKSYDFSVSATKDGQAITAAPVASKGGYEVPNGSFELNEFAARSTSSSWDPATNTTWTPREFGSGSSSSMSWAQSSTQSHSGSQSVKLTNTGSGGDDFLGIGAKVPNGTVVTVSAWYYVESYTGGALENRSMLVSARPNGKTYELMKFSGTPPIGQWKQLKGTYTFGADGTLDLRLYSPQGVIYWDDISVTLA